MMSGAANDGSGADYYYDECAASAAAAKTAAKTDQLQGLLRRETDGYLPCWDYLSGAEDMTKESVPPPAGRAEGNGSPLSSVPLAAASSTETVNEAWRQKLCEWCFQVVDHFNFDREAVSFALDYLDRVVAINTQLTREALPKRKFQLLTVTSLYMAIKIHGETDEADGPRRKLRLDAFVELSRGFFSADAIQEMESKILDLLKWRVNPPSFLRFISSFLGLCPTWAHSDHPGHGLHTAVMRQVYDVARYLTELSLCVSHFSFQYRTSTVSYAAILCALEALKAPLPDAVRADFYRTVADATGIRPDADEIRRAYAQLKSLCPTMFPVDEEDEAGTDDDEMAAGDGRTVSPVSAFDFAAAEGHHPYGHHHPAKHPHDDADDSYGRLPRGGGAEDAASPCRKRNRPSGGSAPAGSSSE